MMPPRVIPVLLLRNRGLVKTVRFTRSKYVGDPINAVRIFNEKEVDELLFLDIDASRENRDPPYDLLERLATECFMPLSYGGGVRTIEQMRRLFALGIEKVSLNTAAHATPQLVRAAADMFGSSSVVVSIDVKSRAFGGRAVVTHGGTRRAKIDPESFALGMERQGAGEILLNSVDRDGTMQGYDLELVRSVSSNVSIPVVACGGASKLSDLAAVIDAGASAAAAGSMFVFHGPHRAVLITYPSYAEFATTFSRVRRMTGSATTDSTIELPARGSER